MRLQSQLLHRCIRGHKDAFSTAAEQRHGHRDGHGVPIPGVSLKKQGTVPVSVTDFAKVKTALDSAMPSETYHIIPFFRVSMLGSVKIV